MKNILTLALILLFITVRVTLEAQSMRTEPSQSTIPVGKRIIADETTFQQLPRLIKVVSCNQEITMGLISVADSGIVKYVVEHHCQKTGERYTEYTLFILPAYQTCVLNYFKTLL